MVSEPGSNPNTPNSSRSPSPSRSSPNRPTTPTNPRTPLNMSDQSTLVNPAMKDLTVVTFPSTLKLNSSNFLAWKTQVQALLYGLDLFKFIDGSHPKPAPTTNADGSQVPATTYPQWFRQDRLIFGALVGSLSDEIVPMIQSTETSKDAWELLEKTYASPSRGHLKQLRHRLKQTTKLPSQSISDYMRQIKNITDELALLGKMDTEDIINAILDGLDASQYKPILDAVHARDTTISFNGLHEKLITHELSLASQPAEAGMHQPAAVFHVQQQHRSSPGQRWPPRNNQAASATTYHRNMQNGHGGLLPTPAAAAHPVTGARTFLGRCQWCHQRGHTLTNCPLFKRLFPTINIPSFDRNSSHKQAQVNTMGLAQAPDQANWIFDSGASHHVTSDLNNLAFHAPYDGTEELVIGDGSGSSHQSQAPPGHGGQGHV